MSSRDSDIGVALLREGNTEEALNHLQRAWRQRPQDVRLRFLLASALHMCGRFDEALNHLARVVSADPSHLDAHNAKATIYFQLGRFDDARQALVEALTVSPTDERTTVNLARLDERSNPAHALALLEGVLERNPRSRDALLNASAIHLEGGRHAQAEILLQRLLEFHPNDVEALINLGQSLLREDRYEAALDVLDRASGTDPENPRVRVLIGIAYSALGRFQSGKDAFAKAFAVDPNVLDGWPGYSMDNQTEQSIDPRLFYLRAGFRRLERVDWTDYEAFVSTAQALFERAGRDDPPLSDPGIALSSYYIPLSNEARGRVLDQIGATIRARAESHPRLWAAPTRSANKIRLGYLVQRIGYDVDGRFLPRLIENHDRERFEVTVYSLDTAPDPRVRSRLQQSAHGYVELATVDDFHGAHKIYHDGTDVLIDIAGYARGARPHILGYRPASVQIGYHAFHGSLTDQLLDYHIVDPTSLCKSEAKTRSERFIYLRDTLILYDDSLGPARQSATRESENLPPDAFVLAALHTAGKIDPCSFAMWLTILLSREETVLWLGDLPSTARHELLARAEAEAITPTRFIFASRAPYAHHINRLRLADLFLDTRWVGAHTTAAEALAAGVPLVTLLGENIYSRIGAGVLEAAGLAELITEQPSEYVALVKQLVRSPETLARLRSKLRTDRDGLALLRFENQVRQIESGIETAWQNYLSGNEPETIFVSLED